MLVDLVCKTKSLESRHTSYVIDISSVFQRDYWRAASSNLASCCAETFSEIYTWIAFTMKVWQATRSGKRTAQVS